MHGRHLLLAAVVCTATAGCFDSDELPPCDSETGEALAPSDEPTFASLPLEQTGIWEPCLLDDDGQEYNGWGCLGVLGEGLACLHSVSEPATTICVPQTADPYFGADCSGAPKAEVIGAEIDLQGSAYCVLRCEVDSDCGAGTVCAGVTGAKFCAWPEL